jgi:hypothetical protein
MSQIRRVTALLVLAVVGLVGCAHEWRSVADPHPATVADMKAVLRDRWSGHIFWVRNVVLDNATNDRRAQDFAEKAVVANAKQIAGTFTPFYGGAASEKLFTLLTSHYGAVKAYSEATVAGNKRQQEKALADYASNTDEIATFLCGANPYLPKDTVQGLIAVHGNHHVAQITQFQERDYTGEEATWQVMQHHVYVIADTMTAALAKQFPAKFS